jgi:uncharacterized phage-associated protein
MANVHNVAAYILEKCGAMSTMKLQKLVYYSQAWHLVWVEEPLFDEEIEAWANGPVVYELFDRHRGQFSVSEWEPGDGKFLDPSERGTIDAVIENYGDLTGRQLSALTHAEAPWRDARAGLGPTDRASVPISKAAIADYYTAVDLDEDAREIDELTWGEEPQG